MDQRNPGQDGLNAAAPVPSSTSQRPDSTADQPTIVEERISTVNGDPQIRRYSKGRMLGKGGFAKCYEFVNLENKKVQAAKIIAKSSLTKSRAKQKLLSEIKIHRSLHQINIVKFEHVFEDSESVYILLELCSNQTLNELLKRRKRLHELEVQCYTVQIIHALKYLHSNRIIHRDLKLGNLFLNDKMEIKIGDFGLATKLEFDGEKKRTICGTPNYIAPEILDGKIGHSYEVDVWSLGVIIYTLIIGKPPFETPDVKTTYKKIRMNNYTFPENVQISDPAKNLITKILNLDPSRRPTLDEMLDHPFINSGGTIPKTLPISTLACPPSKTYIDQHMAGQKGAAALKTTTGMPAGKTAENLAFNSTSSKPNLTNNMMATSTTPKSNGFGMMDMGGMNRNTTTGNFQGQFASTTNFNSTGNPNNQAMMASNKDIKMESMKPFGQKGFESVTVGTTSNMLGNVSQPRSMRSEVHVKKWVDYSTKYGLGYVLSNGSSGVFFNDSTKIILEPNGTTFEYIEKKTSNKTEQVSSYKLDNYPKELHKKVVLLQHFKSYLEGEPVLKDPTLEIDEESKKIGMVYVKKWLKTKHAIMFRLNNKIVQVDFTDKTEIILSSEQKLVTYVNKKGERSQYPLATAMESSNLEMAKRLKYTKDILTNMLNTNQKEAGKEKEGEDGAPKGEMGDGAFEVPT